MTYKLGDKVVASNPDSDTIWDGVIVDRVDKSKWFYPYIVSSESDPEDTHYYHESELKKR